MPQQNNTQGSPWLVILIAAGLFFWWQNSRQPLPVVPPKPDDEHEVEPLPVAEPTEADYWSAIAQCVDRSSFGALQQHTDHLLSVVDVLKTTGAIKDDSRVSSWRAKRVEITDANRAEISKQLRGR